MKEWRHPIVQAILDGLAAPSDPARRIYRKAAAILPPSTVVTSAVVFSASA
ncbi:hypothetical protein DFP91_1692 [Pseudorhodoplanes sinuspersici]|nr:hypothetical protein DFP91_1692 [Pseudorhodoplanes sinuspersici]